MSPIPYPKKLYFLIKEPARYKILWGGRGGGKTEAVAMAAIVLATQKKLRILCLREIQNSIQESIYETIKNRIVDMHLEDKFDVQSHTITCKVTGSEFIFSGIRYKINSLKSLARIDIAIIDEADVVSRSSWIKLPPTIRGRHETDPNGMGGPFGKGPEIWIAFNPQLDTDETYKRFVLQREKYAPDFIKNEETGELERYAFCVKVNHSDNPWMPRDLKLEMELMKSTDNDEWLHVWEGHTKQTITGAIYEKEIKKVLLDGRRSKVSYDPTRPVHTFWDLGHNDHTAIWFVQQVGVEYNLINYMQDRLQKIQYYLEYLQNLKYVYGFHHLPHDAENETLASRSTAKFVRDVYPGKVRIVPRVSKKIVGIRAARAIFDLCNFDEENTADGWQCLCRYQYKVDDKTGQFSNEPLHNEYSNGCFIASTEILTREGLKAISALPENGEVLTLWGWKPYRKPCLTRANARLVEVIFSDGYTVKCTPDHLFLTTANEWKSAENLTKGLLIQSGLVKLNNSLMTEYIEYISQTNILQVLNRCIETFGKQLSEKFQNNAIFIIETKIKQIIAYIIWNVFHIKSICLILQSVNGKTEDLLGFPMMQERLQSYGTNHQKVNNGTNNKPLLYGKNKLNVVSSAIKNLKRCLNKNIVQQIVPNLIMQKNEQLNPETYISGKNYVKNVVLSLYKNLKGAVKTKNFVLKSAGNKLIIKDVRVLKEFADVWCITVPECGHFSLANGAIVHNCDGFQTFALSLKSETATKPKPRLISTGPHLATRGSTGWMGS